MFEKIKYGVVSGIGNFFYKIAEVCDNIGDKFDHLAVVIYTSNMKLGIKGICLKKYLKSQYVDGPYDESKRIEDYENGIDNMIKNITDEDGNTLTREEAAQAMYEILDSMEVEDVGENC